MKSVRLSACSTIVALVASHSPARAQFGPEQIIDTATGDITRMRVAELDGDGKPDIIVCRYVGAAVAWYRYLGAGGFSIPLPVPGIAPPALDALAMDADGDGDSDLVAGVIDPAGLGGSSMRVNLHVNQGSGNFALPTTILPVGYPVLRVQAADLEGDGDLDLFVGRRASGSLLLSTIEVIVFQGSGYSPSPIELMDAPLALSDFGVTDVDGDGDADLVVATLAGPGQILWIENPGTPGLFPGMHPIEPSVAGASSIEIADLDGDHRPDVVANSALGICSYRNAGGGLFGGATVITTTGGPQGAICGDVDGDTDADIVVRELYGASWYANDGQGNFGSAHPITNGPYTPRSIVMTDFDADGLPDLVVGSALPTGGVRLGWFHNEYQAAVPFCFGDGSGTSCPCGNIGIAGRGCASSVDSGGARLSGSGPPSISNDVYVLAGTHMPNSAALYFQGTQRLNSGNGLSFGDGLRCVGGTILRLGTKTNVAGISGYPGAGDVPISIKGNLTAGDVRQYQCWYRNAAAFCTTATYNLTNALEVTWTP